MLCLFEKRPRKTKQRIEDSWCLQVALGPGEGHWHTWGQELSFSLHCLCLYLTSSRPGGPAPLKPRLFFPEPAFLQGFALDPQAVCVLSIHSLLREDEFGEAFLLFPGARFLHSRGVLGAWSWWHSQVAELVGSAFGKERNCNVYKKTPHTNQTTTKCNKNARTNYLHERNNTLFADVLSNARIYEKIPKATWRWEGRNIRSASAYYEAKPLPVQTFL